MKRASILSTIIVGWSLSTDLLAQDWEIDRIGGPGSGPSLTLDSFDMPHMAYHLLRNGQEEIYYGKWNEATQIFDTELIDQGSFEAFISIITDQNDFPHITHHIHNGGGNLRYLHNDGNAWIAEDIPTVVHDGWSSSIKIDSRNLPHVSFLPGIGLGGLGVEYAWHDGLSWHAEYIGSEPDLNHYWGTSLALDREDNPHVTYYDDALQDLMYAVKEDSVWTIVPIDTAGDVGYFSSLRLDGNDLPRIAYLKYTFGEGAVVKHASFSGMSWVISSIDTLQAVYPDPSVQGMISLDLNEAGNSHIAFTNREILTYAVITGLSIEKETVVDLSSTGQTLGGAASLKLDTEGNPHIVYDVQNGSQVGPMYARRLGTTDVGSQGQMPHAFILGQNYPNPFNPETTIGFDLPRTAFVTLRLYNMLGQEVATLVNGQIQAGTHSVSVSGPDLSLPSGVYMYRLNAENFVQTRKMVLLR